MTQAVRLTGVTKTYGAVRAVNGIDLSVNRGEAVALLGPNGAGKSTTINMLLGLHDPTQGKVEVFGTSPATAVQTGKVGAMLQESGFVGNATVREVIELSRALYKNPLATKDVLAMADLDEVADRRLDKLSGGQSQRVRFAFAIAGNPDLLLLDEPTVAMDVETRHAFWLAMRRFTETGRTILFATHYLEEADEYADRVIVVAQGKIVADGPGAEIKKMVAGRVVSFSVNGEGTDWLSTLDGVKSMEIRGDRVHLQCEDSDAAVRGIVQSGRKFKDMEITGAGLEAAFLELTSKGKE